MPACLDSNAMIAHGHPMPREPKERLIVALDVDTLQEAERLVKALAPHVGTFKVGPRLFTSSGPLVLDLVHGMGADLFLDLKFHDIPATVAAAAHQVARRRVKMFTVHALGGARMIEAVAKELSELTLIPGAYPPLVLGVTVLTSHSPDELTQMGINRPLADLSHRLARLAVDSGATGIVASGHELADLRAKLRGDTVYVVPGIRGPDDAVGDQVRVMTAREAIEAGATYLVVGRPIRLAEDPAGAAQRVLEDIHQAQT